MARSLKQRQKNANGSVAPAKIPEGQQPSKPQTGCPTDTTKTSRKSRIKTCSTCGHTATKLAEMRSHFAGCVEVNGTPTGGQKDFGFTFMPPSHLAKRKFDDLDDDK